MQVERLGFLVDRLGEDCAPLQYIRELTQNSIEAIRRTEDGSGEIIWDVDWNTLDLSGVFKLSISDTGDGMTAEEQVRFINHLSASIQEQSLEGNYGVGAKIAGATRNRAGMLYLSWKGGLGSMIHLWRDPELEEYGLKRFELDDGTYAEVLEPDEALKPDEIDVHGTKVVLFGNVDDVNTVAAPEGTKYPSRWLSRYLNTRYFRFPDGIRVRAREFARTSEDEWPRAKTQKMAEGAMLRTVDGQGAFLDKFSESSGSVDLNGAKAHWWILKEDDNLRGVLHYETRGHVAALWENELYELASGKSGTSRLQEFGVVFGYRRVVIYMEPMPGAKQRITTNTARTRLLVNSEPVPWSHWAEEFRNRMPDEIRDLVEDTAPSSSDHQEAIRRRLREIAELFRHSRYRPARRGAETIDPESPLVGGSDSDETDDTNSRRGASGGGSGGRLGAVYALFAKQAGDPADEIQGLAEPHVDWVSVEDGSRETGDIEDRAAKYLLEQNTILANRDFRGFTDMVKRWLDRYEGYAGAETVVPDIVEEWFTQQLIEAVLGVQALRGARYWTSEDIGHALSEEALTAAVMPRYHVDKQVGRNLGHRLGSLRAQAR